LVKKKSDFAKHTVYAKLLFSGHHSLAFSPPRKNQRAKIQPTKQKKKLSTQREQSDESAFHQQKERGHLI